MLEKVDYKKDFKELYAPKPEPALISVPMMKFAVIEGKGDPNGETFAQDTAALYSFSYVVKMSYKSGNIPDGYFDYTVFPLEGVWDLDDKTKEITDKSNFKYRIMIRQPDFLTRDLFDRFLTEAKRKKPSNSLIKIIFEEIEEGLCCQMLHMGSYDNEPANFEKMNRFIREKGYKRTTRYHREIYLGDPRKTEASKLKTILRVKVESI